MLRNVTNPFRQKKDLRKNGSFRLFFVTYLHEIGFAIAPLTFFSSNPTVPPQTHPLVPSICGKLGENCGKTNSPCGNSGEFMGEILPKE
jgi:hypothetical protein